MQRKWCVELDGKYAGTPAVSTPSGAVVIATTAGGYVIAHSIKDGRRIWRFNCGTAIADSTPCISGGRVFIGAASGIVSCVDLIVGELLWTAKVHDSVSTTIVAYGGNLVVGTDSGCLYCISQDTGEIKWIVRTPSHLTSHVDEVSCDPVVVPGNRVLFGSANYNLYCIDIRDGTVQWSFETDFWVQVTPLVVGDTAYIGSFCDLCAIGMDDGKLLWRHPADNRELCGSLVYVEGAVIYGGLSGVVHCVDLHNRMPRWRYATNAPVVRPLMLLDKRVFVPSYDGYLYVLDAHSGEKLSAIPAEDPSACKASERNVFFNDLTTDGSRGRLNCLSLELASSG